MALEIWNVYRDVAMEENENEHDFAIERGEVECIVARDIG